MKRFWQESYSILCFCYFVWFACTVYILCTARNRERETEIDCFVYSNRIERRLNQQQWTFANDSAGVFANARNFLFSRPHIFTFSSICLHLIPLFRFVSFRFVWYLLSLSVQQWFYAVAAVDSCVSFHKGIIFNYIGMKENYDQIDDDHSKTHTHIHVHMHTYIYGNILIWWCNEWI